MGRAREHGVLVADGNRDAADSLVMLLEALGFEARAAYRGDEALAQWRAWRPEVVIMDIVLPGIPGLRLARQLSCTRERPWLIALTGYTHPAWLRDARAVFDRVLLKPATPQELLDAMPRPQTEASAGEAPRANAAARATSPPRPAPAPPSHPRSARA